MFKPIGKRVLVSPIEQKNETASGIIVQTNLSKTRSGNVVALGTDVADINVGDVVLFSTEVGLNVGQYKLIGVVDILAIVV